MKLFKYLKVLALLLLINDFTNATIPLRKGWWKFDDLTTLTKAEIGYGSDLQLIGTQTAVTGPEAGNGAVNIGVGSYYKMLQGINPGNGGGTLVNEYTLQYDFKISSLGAWRSFFQTTVANNDDADFFINTSGNIGVGAVGYSTSVIAPNTWYRLIISVKNGTSFNVYLDGVLFKSGTTQALDGRFALASTLLVFADNDGEDGEISCAELAIWDKALNDAEVAELGGFGNVILPYKSRIPYLQGETSASMNICWHDYSSIGTSVDYGTDSTNLNQNTPGTSELLNSPYRWHTVKLTGLQPNTHYYYKVNSGGVSSSVYGLKTLPDAYYTGKLRFVLLSDTHCPDSTVVGKVLRAARSKIKSLYGADVENQINGIFHSGDITMSGNAIDEYYSQYFRPMSTLSSNIPVMVVAGNHEGENPYFYQYLKLNDQSAFPNDSNLNEKIWQTKICNSLFIGLNTNITATYGTTQANWLDNRLSEADADASIDFVFLFFHHFPYSELWNVNDAGDLYARNTLLPILKKHFKVQQIHNGHTHGFERGTIHSEITDVDFRAIIGGGGGGNLDTWGNSLNHDYNDYQIAISHNFYQILEIDPQNHSWNTSMYSIGSPIDVRNNELMDFWYKKMNQTGPEKPSIENVSVDAQNVQFNSSSFVGVDSLMSVQYRVTDNATNNTILVDSITHRKKIYGLDSFNKPFDKNMNIDLYQSKISKSKLMPVRTYAFTLRYCDNNLKWSTWSNTLLFNINGLTSINEPKENNLQPNLLQNYPNPFIDGTNISYCIAKKSFVKIRFYDVNNRLVDEISFGQKTPGNYQLNYSGEKLVSGIYFCELITQDISIYGKMIKL